jgi:hypothetical protein
MIFGPFEKITFIGPNPLVQRLKSERVSLDRFSRTMFQRFLSNPLRSSFKKRSTLTPRQVQSLPMMSLAKAVPEGIRDKECKRFALRACQERIPSKKQFPPSKVTRVLKRPSRKMRNYVSPSGTVECMRLFSCT